MKSKGVQSISIPVAEPELGEEELRNVVQAVKSGWISSKGEFIRRFEEGFARYCGARYGVATSSGTTALHLALTALGIGPGDEVLVPSLTFVATANAVVYTGARPVFIDSHPDYWCMDPDKLEEQITSRTKAIIPVHLYGHPCNMDAVVEIAERHNLYLVEDAAEAHGAEYKRRKVGSFGYIACFSFYGNKIITTGEGGMCLTSDEGLYRKMLVLRDHGATPGRQYWHERIGFNYRMTNLQAAVGVAQLEKLDDFVQRKRRLAGWYNSLLGETEGIRLPVEMRWARNVYWIYSFLVTDGFPLSRDELMARLAEEGIETRPLFWAVHLLPPYRDGRSLPQAERLCQSGISLPSAVTMTQEQVEHVAALIQREACRR
jgi:perosamine synthetase